MKQPPDSIFHSNGNLIISGEYFVLAGAMALAVPLKSGQTMKIVHTEDKKEVIRWTANVTGKLWFKAEFNCDSLEISASSDDKTTLALQKLLKNIRTTNEDFFSKKGMSYNITCDIDFSLNWGWGSSATLIANLANYAGIDPFILNRMVSSGSGYDIAASLSDSPVFYRLTGENREVCPTPFNPLFKDFIRFIYLGRKQSTASGIESSIRAVNKNISMIPQISCLTELIATTKDLREFSISIMEHEKIISKTLNIKRIKNEYFSDFEGEIKSLGAWGGDSAMIVSETDEAYVSGYFEGKGLKTIFGFDEIVKT